MPRSGAGRSSGDRPAGTVLIQGIDALGRFEVTAFVKTGDDHQFDGYEPVDPLALVGDFTVAAADIGAVPETFFAIGNRMGADADGHRRPSDVRSLSNGDLTSIRNLRTRETRHLAVASFGRTDVIEPANRIVSLAGSNTSPRHP